MQLLRRLASLLPTCVTSKDVSNSPRHGLDQKPLAPGLLAAVLRNGSHANGVQCILRKGMHFASATVVAGDKASRPAGDAVRIVVL